LIEAESQTVLNTVAEHDFQDALRNGRISENGAYAKKETTSGMVVVNRSTVLNQMAATSRKL
jgi:hypothetical protein